MITDYPNNVCTENPPAIVVPLEAVPIWVDANIHPWVFIVSLEWSAKTGRPWWEYPLPDEYGRTWFPVPEANAPEEQPEN